MAFWKIRGSAHIRAYARDLLPVLRKQATFSRMTWPISKDFATHTTRAFRSGASMKFMINYLRSSLIPFASNFPLHRFLLQQCYLFLVFLVPHEPCYCQALCHQQRIDVCSVKKHVTKQPPVPVPVLCVMLKDDLLPKHKLIQARFGFR